jgi:hypothetical protein
MLSGEEYMELITGIGIGLIPAGIVLLFELYIVWKTHDLSKYD